MNNLDDMLPVCHDCPYWEVCKPPYVCVSWDKMIHPDMDAIEKRDAFLSDENGKKLQKMIDQIHLMEEILDVEQEKV